MSGLLRAMATAGLVADVFLQTSAQVLFAVVGGMLLVRVVGASTVVQPLLFAAAAAFLYQFYIRVN